MKKVSDCKVLSVGTMMTVPTEEAPANFVPAAAVIRRGLALLGMTGRKGRAGGLTVRCEIPGLNLGGVHLIRSD